MFSSSILTGIDAQKKSEQENISIKGFSRLNKDQNKQKLTNSGMNQERWFWNRYLNLETSIPTIERENPTHKILLKIRNRKSTNQSKVEAKLPNFIQIFYCSEVSARKISHNWRRIKETERYEKMVKSFWMLLSRSNTNYYILY